MGARPFKTGRVATVLTALIFCSEFHQPVYSAEGDAGGHSGESQSEIETRGMQRMQPTVPLEQQLRVIPATPLGSPVVGQSACRVVPNTAGQPDIPPTHFHTLSGPAFVPEAVGALSGSAAIRYSGRISEGGVGAAIGQNVAPTEARFAAPVFLPHGALIREIQIVLRDNDPQSDLTVMLAARGIENMQPVGYSRVTIESNCVQGPGFSTILVRGLTLPFSSQHAWSLSLQWNIHNLVGAPLTGTTPFIDVYFVRIGYTVQ